MGEYLTMSPWQRREDARLTPRVRVCEVLAEEMVLLPFSGTEKAAMLEALVRRVCEKSGLADFESLLGRVLERERGISTTLDTGLSLPHVRVEGLDRIIAGLAVAPRGVADAGEPQTRIRVMFLFFSPNKAEFFPLHLQLLRGVASLFQPVLIEAVAGAASPGEAFELIRRAQG